ncbi:MAG: hypothetical protein ACKO24_18195 [Leptolyngbyaceae cyanobacterium]
MARKSLADLLREEVNKPGEAEAESPQKQGTGQAKSHPKTSEKSATERSRQSSPKAPPPPKASEKKNGEADQADAELVSRLQDELDLAQRWEASLTEQLEQLQKELEAQNTLIASLKQDLRKYDALAEELKHAKAAALQLAEANAKLTEELNHLRQVAKPEPGSAQPLRSRNRTTTDSADRQALAVKPSQPELPYSPEIRRRQEASLAHPMFPAGPMPGSLTNQDLGWVD